MTDWNSASFNDILHSALPCIFPKILIKSIFINIAKHHDHIASMGFTICTVNDIVCPQTLEMSEEQLSNVEGLNRKRKMEETSGGTTGEDPLPGRTDIQQMSHVQKTNYNTRLSIQKTGPENAECWLRHTTFSTVVTWTRTHETNKRNEIR